MKVVHLPNPRCLIALWLLGVACASGKPGEGACPSGECEDRTVRGHISSSDGRPLDGVQVLIPGHAVVLSDENGEFVVEEVVSPYELAFVQGDKTTVFQGITRRDPAVTAKVPGESRSALVRGRASGGAGFPATALHRAAIVLEAGRMVSPSTVIGQDDGSFDIDANWKTDQSITAVVHGLQWRTTADGRFDAFTGHGTSAPFALHEARIYEGRNVVMTAVGTARLSGSAALPAGGRLNVVQCTVDIAAGAEINVWDAEGFSGPGLPTQFECPVPELESARAKIYLEGAASGHLRAIRTSDPGTSGTVQVSFPAAPTLVSPAEGATDATLQTLYSWTGETGLARLELQSASGSSFSVITSKSEVRLPDLTPLGVDLPRNAAMGMTVTIRTEATTVDQMLESGWVTAMAGNVTESFSDVRAFATAP